MDKLWIGLLLLAVLSPIATAYTNADAVGKSSGEYWDWGYYAPRNIAPCPWPTSNPDYSIDCLLVKGSQWSMGMWVGWPYDGYRKDFGTYLAEVEQHENAQDARMDSLEAQIRGVADTITDLIRQIQLDILNLQQHDTVQDAQINNLTANGTSSAGIPQGMVEGNFSACQQKLNLNDQQWKKAQNPNCLAQSNQYPSSTYYYPRTYECSQWKAQAKKGGSGNAFYYCEYMVYCEPCEVPM